jgi:hypothetical protein
MHRSANNNNLLILGGVALVAAALLLKPAASEDSGGGGGGGSTTPWTGSGGTTPGGSTAPIVYQIPADTFTGFPAAPSFDLSSLFSGLMGGAAAPTGNPDSSTKKQAMINQGNIVIDQKGNAWQKSNDLGVYLGGPMTLMKTGPSGVIDYAGASSGAAIQTKKEATVSGFSGQNVLNPANGLNLWNGANGYGLSKDPVTGQMVPYQRDIDIMGPNGPVYAADGSVGTKKDAMTQIDYTYNGTNGYNQGAMMQQSPYEWSKVAAQANPNYVVGSWYGATKKELSTYAPSSNNNAPPTYSAPSWDSGGAPTGSGYGGTNESIYDS